VPSAPAYLVVSWSNSEVALHDRASGRVVTRLATLEAASYVEFDRAPNGAIFVTSGIEDSWYACSTAQGTVDVLSGPDQAELVGAGAYPRVDATGSRVAYLRSSGCRQDPTQHDFPDMITNFDTVVVRDVASGAEQTWTFPGAVLERGAPSVVTSLAWSGDKLVVQSGNQRLGVLDPTERAVPDISRWPSIRVTEGDADTVAVLAARADGTVLASVGTQDDDRARLAVLDLATGTERPQAATTVVEGRRVDVDITGTHWVAVSSKNQVLVDGRVVTLEVPPNQLGPGSDQEVFPVSAGW
jgi:hypothetical protein